MISIFKFFKGNKAISLSLFLVSSFYFYSGIFFGLDFTDSFYHLNQALDPADEVYLYPFFLSSIIVKGIVEMVGPEIINLRFINSTLVYFSLLFPFLVNNAKIFKPKNLYLISLILILFAPFNVNILGYDSLSIFILSIIFSVTVLYFRKPRSYLLLILSILSAAAILIRIPNVLVVPILLISIGLTRKNDLGAFSGKMIANLLGYLILTLFLLFIVYTWYYHKIEDFFNASANATSHNFRILIKNYFIDGIHIISFILLILGGYFLMKNKKNHFPNVVIFGLVGIFFFLFILLFVAFTNYFKNYSFFVTSISVSLILMQVLQNKRRRSDSKNPVLFLFLIFLLINPFGSNTGLLKATFLVVLLPFVLSYVNFKMNGYWLLIFFILIPFSILENFYKTYEDQGILHLDQRLENEVLYPVKTTSRRSEFLKGVDMEVKQLKEKNIPVFFYGDKSHIFHYLYPDSDLNINSFYQPLEDMTYYPHIKKVINDNENAAIILVGSYPEIDSNAHSVLETRLVTDGLKKIETKFIIYYLKK